MPRGGLRSFPVSPTPLPLAPSRPGEGDFRKAIRKGRGCFGSMIRNERGAWKTGAWSTLALLALLASGVPCQAQERLGLQPAGRGGEERRPLLDELAPPETPKLEVPQVPPPQERAPGERVGGRVFVRKVEVTGVTAFPPEEIRKVTAPYEDRELTSEDLEALRVALTVLYVNRGYVNSGAVIPDQAVAKGVVRLHVIEGELTRIDVEGNRWFRDAYVRRRLALGAERPLNVALLQQRLQLLQQNPLIDRIRAELKPGVGPGESVLKVDVEEEIPYDLTLSFDNYQSPSVGAERGRATAEHRNLTGNGDTLSLTYGRSEGVNPQIDAWYCVPFTAQDTSLTLRYQKNNYVVVEEPFDDLDVESKSEIYGVTLRQPLYRSLANELAISLTGEHLRNETYLLHERFSFSPGVEDGESIVTALRLTPEWVYRTRSTVVAASSRFSVGVPALGATTHHDDDVPDGRFLAWLGQFQWAEVLHRSGLHTIFRTDIQISNDSLLPLEQIAVGGRYSVRGYRENQLVRDNAIIGSLEARQPLFRDKSWADYLEIAPFVDWGRGWNTDEPTPSPEFIWSAGVGLRWAAAWLERPFRIKPRCEIYWGHPFKDVDTEGGDLQDDGIHFQLAVTVP